MSKIKNSATRIRNEDHFRNSYVYKEKKKNDAPFMYNKSQSKKNLSFNFQFLM